jgi:hypothetical protein
MVSRAGLQLDAHAVNPLRTAREKAHTDLEVTLPPSQRLRPVVLRFPASAEVVRVSVTSSTAAISEEKLQLNAPSEVWETTVILSAGRYLFHFVVNNTLRTSSPLHERDGDENVVVVVDELHALVSSFCEHAAALPTARFPSLLSSF